MANATAAGPSRGLLDVIFGSNKDAETAEADGQEFGGLMALIKQLKGNKDAEEKSAELGRTLRETSAGKGVAEGNVVGMPVNSAANDSSGFPFAELPANAGSLTEQDRQQRLALLGQLPAGALMLQAPVQPGPLPGVQPEQVNRILRQSNLPPLSPQEMKLLQDVNGKIAQANAGEQGAAMPRELLAATPGAAALEPVHPKAAVPGEQPVDPQLQKAMAAKGLDPRKLKAAGAEAPAASGTPEKILSTETYLQMHENAKAPAKELAGKGPQTGANEGPALPASARPAEGVLTASAVAAAGQKGLSLKGRERGDQPEAQSPEGAKQAKLDAPAGTFGAAIPSAAETMRHDVYLPGADKPEQMRGALLTEVGSGVALHAHKGGGEMRLVIHPDDLGEVKLKVGTKNGKVEVQVTAQNDEVARMIREGSKELEASLKDQNLSLTKFEVSVGDTTNVVATDTKSSLSDQFLSQNQQQPQHGGGFSGGMSADDGRGSHWAGDFGNGGGRQASGYGSPSGSQGGSARAASSSPRTPARDSTRRLDVVA